MKKIIAKKGSVKKICEILGCKYGVVYNAFNFKKDNELAKKIRKIALELGCSLVEINQ